MKLTQAVVELAIQKAINCISNHLSKEYVYHDLSHTIAVAEGVKLIAGNMQISSEHKRLLTVAAWFHDIGYIHGADGHETCGAKLLETFLQQHGIDGEDIEIAKGCILATTYPQQPHTLLQRIICDADMIHFASKNFILSSKRLRHEWGLTKGYVYTDRDWWQFNLDFILGHHYHTSYAQKFFVVEKERNRKIVEKKIECIDIRYAILEAQ